MKKYNFTKMVASGNDFIILNYGLRITDYGLRNLSVQLCDRKYGIGADGVLVLGKSRAADIRMRIFNADGSEAEMCGNGARCAALYARSRIRKEKLSIETKAGIIQACVKADRVKIRLTDPKGIKLNIPLKINGRALKVNFVDTGVPHAVIFVNGIDGIDVLALGRRIRHHQAFAPRGANVNFVEIAKDNFIRVRTYERGVEDETLACGTGSVASALITDYRLRITDYGFMNIKTQGGEVLKVYYSRCGNIFRDVWLEGKAKRVFEGVVRIP